MWYILLVAVIAFLVGMLAGILIHMRVRNHPHKKMKALWPDGAKIGWVDPEYGYRRGTICGHKFLPDGRLVGVWVDYRRQLGAPVHRFFVPIAAASHTAVFDHTPGQVDYLPEEEKEEEEDPDTLWDAIKGTGW